MEYTLYNKAGAVLGRFSSREAAMHAYKNWAESWTLFKGDEIVKTKW